MDRRIVTVRRVPWLLAGWTLALTASGVGLRLLRPQTYHGPADAFLDGITTIVGSVGIASLGAVVASRRPRNPVGWCFIAVGLSFGYDGFVHEYVIRAVVTNPGSLPFADWFAWLAGWTSFVVGWIPVILIPYTFPTGRLVSRRWTIGLAVGLFAVTILGISTALTPDVLPDYVKTLKNPVASKALSDAFERLVHPIGGIVWFLPFISLMIGGASLFVRFRRSGGIERQQLKWMAFSGVFVAAGGVALVVNATAHGALGGIVPPGLIIVGMGSMPITASIAILRFRLYEVDRLLSRTVSYLLITLVLGGLYAVVALIPAVVFKSSRAPEVFTAVGTLLAAAAFVPVRRRVQHTVDRRFNRARYNAERTIERFGAKLRLEFDVDALATELSAVVRETMQPATVGLWLRPR